ncbi:TonB-dependent receptor [uncultured Erythrobacter sp.]|uniref:TonB-dependent receptor n=1 Tax=uncultured Erythrobacter sp. TaxID=263913 RepID=UPI0026052049|nr:TonB-dependent receptor [uncultured Erythrobacter sp.]
MKLSRACAAGGVVSKSLLSGVSTLGLLAAAPAVAQDQPDADEPETAEPVEEGELIIVTGIRASLESAQNVKRNADTFVDVITASDIGALPDRSVSEALQRVPGVSVLRFAGPNDPDHFAVEGSGVVIRGLPFVRSELNGRDVFAANSGGVLGFEDVSPELLGSVVVFKNSSADLIEGGAAGTIDLRTRLPFDQGGQVIAASVEAQLTDFADEVTPGGSFLYSNTWDVGGGTFGLLGNISYNRLKSRGDGTGIADFRDNDPGPLLNDPSDDSNFITDANGNPLFIPSGGSIRTQEFDRERLSIAAAAQYESADGRWLATAQFLRSDSTLLWGENVIETAADGAARSRPGLDRSDFVFDDDGVFTAGTITDNSQWRGPNVGGYLAPNGGQQINLYRERLEEDITNDYGFNLKFSATDNLRFNFDAQYIDSTSDVFDLTVHTSFFSPVTIDSSVGRVPFVGFEPSNSFIRSAMDHTTQNDAESLAFRGDVEYDFSGDGWLKSLRAGARYSDQEILIRESDFNWGNISEVWTGRDVNGGGDPLVRPFDNPNPAVEAVVAPLFGRYAFPDYQRGVGAGFQGLVPSYAGPGAEDFDGWQETFNNVLNVIGGSPSGWTPLTGRDGVIEGTPFLPSEIGSVTRETIAAYVRADFGADNFLGGELTGNVGLRYVRTDRSVDTTTSVRSFATLFPALVDTSAPGDPTTNACDPAFPGRADPTFSEPAACANRAQLLAQFGDGQIIQQRVDVDYDEFLPSLNLKLEFDGGHLLRFAASRTMTRPGVTQLNERVQVQVLPDTSTGIGQPNSFGGFSSNATGNASLLPQISTNFDLSWEWYFGRSSSITVTGFYKEIDDFIAFAPVEIGAQFDDLTLLRNTEVNVDENASVKGFEVAYQQFYDFLPGALSGLGMQATYTFIDSEGVANTLDPALASDDPPTARFDIDADVFPRISRHNVNLIGLYEKGIVQARVAYNWRSAFQLTPRDVIFPFASIYQRASGQLDASLFVDVTENLKVGVQGVNLLDEITITEQTINDQGLRAPRNFFRNDRRYTFILRANF